MRRLFEWLGLTDTVDDYDVAYHDHADSYSAAEPPSPIPPSRPANVQVLSDQQRAFASGRNAPPEPMAESHFSPRSVPGHEAPERKGPRGDSWEPPAEGPTRSFPAATATIRPVVPSQSQAVHILYPRRFRDATEVADLMRNGVPVIVNLQNAERDLPRRMIDFCSGVTYALEGKMERVAESVFLLTPSNVTVSQEERDNLSERGVF